MLTSITTNNIIKTLVNKSNNNYANFVVHGGNLSKKLD